MFKQKTLFILGVGASYPYGYPLGSQLIDKIIKDLDDDILIPGPTPSVFSRQNMINTVLGFHEYQKKIQELAPNQIAIEKFQKLNDVQNFYYENENNYYKVKINQLDIFEKLQQELKDSAPVSIDAFLRDNPSFQTAGKIMIIYSLLKRENDSIFGHNRIEDNWYSYLINDIVVGCDSPEDISRNNLNIITFNYDLSLEFCLSKKINELEYFKKNNSATKFINDLKSNNIIHVYGQLYKNDQNFQYGKLFHNEGKDKIPRNFKRFVSAIHVKNNIEIIPENRRKSGKQEQIQRLLKEIDEIIIIGFSFDRDNLDILGFPQIKSEYDKFFKDKRIKYLDYEGKMNSLHDQFEAIANHSNMVFTRSKANRIIDAYQNDFKIYLYQKDKL